MVGRYIYDAPEIALEHARYAVSRAGRVAAVREAAAVAAYENEEFHEALKEFRTYRRMTGDDSHLPLMVDCERALGKSDKALELATSEAVQNLDSAAKVEMAIVVAGIRRDQGDLEGSLKSLEIPQLDRNRGFSYSPRLFRAYAEALRGVGRDREATAWDRQAVVAEAALGMGQFSEPEIFDLVGEEDEPEQGIALDPDTEGSDGSSEPDSAAPAVGVADDDQATAVVGHADTAAGAIDTAGTNDTADTADTTDTADTDSQASADRAAAVDGAPQTQQGAESPAPPEVELTQAASADDGEDPEGTADDR